MLQIPEFKRLYPTGNRDGYYTITPSVAQYILDHHNNKNRPISEGRAKVIASIITRNFWVINGEAIIFLGNILIDGQHRLRACVISGKPIVSLVIFDPPDGKPQKVFDSVDQMQGIRSLKDTLVTNTTNGDAPEYPHLAAPIVNSVIAYEAKMKGEKLKRRPSNREGRLKYVSERKLFNDVCSACHEFSQGFRNLAYPPAVAGTVLFMAGKNGQFAKAKEFFSAVASGLGLNSPSEPAMALRTLLISLQRKEIGGRKGGVYLSGKDAYLRVTMAAWIAHRDGKKINGKLKWEDEINFERDRVLYTPSESYAD